MTMLKEIGARARAETVIRDEIMELVRELYMMRFTVTHLSECVGVPFFACHYNVSRLSCCQG